MARHRLRSGFTIIELLVVVSIIALLVSILLPAVGRAKETAKVAESMSNLRNMAAAHFRYTVDWNDHQFTLIDENISSYGNTAAAAFNAYEQATGQEHPLIYAGWGRIPASGAWVHWVLDSPGVGMYQPISFANDTGSGGERFGSFRLLNVEAFHQYVTGRFYDPIFYAPKDTVPIESVREAFEYIDPVHYTGYGSIRWSSYCFSPAAMFHPQVMRSPAQGGWQDPWTIAGGFRSPSIAQARYTSLKTHFSEHHWLQSTVSGATCNPAFNPGTYDGCEPYYFNHAFESAPVTVFYDGHTELVGVREATRADGRMRTQSGGLAGLWSRDTHWGEDGYFISLGYDQAANSFHVFTTDGILGRDIFSD